MNPAYFELDLPAEVAEELRIAEKYKKQFSEIPSSFMCAVRCSPYRWLQEWGRDALWSPGSGALCCQLAEIGWVEVFPQFREEPKFGGLRFYVQGDGDDAREAVSALIREAEAKAWLTCDTCGAPGETWQMATLCQPCRDKEQASRA